MEIVFSDFGKHGPTEICDKTDNYYTVESLFGMSGMMNSILDVMLICVFSICIIKFNELFCFPFKKLFARNFVGAEFEGLILSSNLFALISCK